VLLALSGPLGTSVLAQSSLLLVNDLLHGYPGALVGPTAFSLDTHTGTGYSIDFGVNGGSGLVVTNASFLNIASSNDVMSFALWIKKYDIADGSAFWGVSPSSSGGERGFQAHVPWSDDNIYFDTDGCCDTTLQRINADINTFAGWVAVGNDSWWTNWHHFVFFMDHGDKQIWIDGQLFLEGTNSSALPTDFSPLWLGLDVTDVLYMHGLVDDFAVYSTALSSNSINLLFNGTSPTNLPGEKILAYWSFDNPPAISPPVGSPIGFSYTLYDTTTRVSDISTLALTLNGQAVTPTSLATNGTIITVSWWDANAPFPIGSTQTVGLTIKDTAGTLYSNTVQVVVAPYPALTPAMAVTNVDTTQAGFNVRPYHVSLGEYGSSNLIAGSYPMLQTMETSVRRAEEEMAGLLGPNDASVSGIYSETGVINYNIDPYAAEGGMDWTATNGVDAMKPFPGIASWTTTTTNDAPQFDNFAVEFTTIIYFPEPGVYNLTFNSDDGFRMTAGNPASDRFNAVLISEYDGGRGSSDTTAEIYVPKEGYYPFRTIYFQGGGGASAEWSAQELYPTATTNALINDPISPTALKCYRGYLAAPPPAYPAAVTFIDPVVNSGTYQPNWPMEAQITDGSAGAISKPALYLNGAPVSATIGKSNAVTTLTYTPATLLPAGSNTLGVSFKDFSGNSQSNAVAFTVGPYTVIPASMALSSSAVNTKNAGFDVYTYKYEGFVDSTNEYSPPVSVYNSELMDHGFMGWPNAADFTVNWTFNGPGNTNYVETNTVCYNGQSGNYGTYYADAGGAGTNMPGVPSQVWPTYDGMTVSDGNGGLNDLCLEIKTVIYLTPGFYTMDVNSDDGFSVSVGNPAEWRTQRLILGEYDGVEGSTDNYFSFYISQAGYYPFTCVYYQGGSQLEVTWMTANPYPANSFNILLNDATASLQVGSQSINPSLVCYQYPFARTKGSPYIESYGPSMFHRNGDSGSITASTHAGYDARIWAYLVDGDNPITTSSVNLWVNGAQVSPTVSKTGNTTSVTYTNASYWTPDTTNTVSLSFLDRTNTWSFMVENHRTATFFIEAEDVDSDGKGLPIASVMPYFGGAYAGLPATPNLDYFCPDQPNGPWYRLANSSSVATSAPLSPNIPMQENYDLDRGVNEVQSNYRIGWIGAGQWFNYTRTFPTGKYNVYAGISNGDPAGTTPHDRYAVLQLVSSTSTNNLGVFDGVATGEWGQNGGVGQAVGLVPLTDPNSNLVSLALSGPVTLRYWLPSATSNTVVVAGIPTTTLQNGSGDWDFMMFTPVGSVAPPPPKVSIQWVSGQVVITFTGTLSSAATVNGTYADVPGATSPYTVPAGTPTTFYRAHYY
jgi:hypothetical protein